ncbi:MAG: aconitate hydratase AcnA [Planctomycetia bacterium]|nr:aconitate hydratase AcnA [Planctomycetia bacterium]
MKTHIKCDPFSARDTFQTGNGTQNAIFYRLSAVEHVLNVDLRKLPYSIRILLESALRHCDNFEVTEADIRNIASWTPNGERMEIPFKPARVILQDFTGVPCVVDLAAMRSAMKRLGGDTQKINPLVPVDLVIDHSVQTDFSGCPEACEENLKLEFQRNTERYALLKWAQGTLKNFQAVPPSVGIIHQVNLEYLAKVVFMEKNENGETTAFPDTLVGTDSHTVMINGLGVLGWGVGGIEAEAVMLGQPMSMLLPDVIGVELSGKLNPGVTATDLVLTVTEMLRKEGVVGKFVEFFGNGIPEMKLADRATLANMAPEYGATMGFFPVDDQTLKYLRQTGRTDAEVKLAENYLKAQGLFWTPDAPIPHYTKVLKLDLSSVTACLAGPKRPQDRVPLSEMQKTFREALQAPVEKRGFGLTDTDISRHVTFPGTEEEITHGAVVIASITSCTNTSNPGVMLAAGLLAKKAVEKGLCVKPWVKTSLAPGSRVVTEYLNHAGFTKYLDQLGFQTVGYGCLTCIGNSGNLLPAAAKCVKDGSLVATAVVSGNRNFEGRVNPLVKANYLASPPLVVAYALAGTTDFNFEKDPLGKDSAGNPIFLRDIFPTPEEINAAESAHVLPEMFSKCYSEVFQKDVSPEDTGLKMWNTVPVETSEIFPWNKNSTYIQEPPFLSGLKPNVPSADLPKIENARVLVMLGDSITTDHISPAGAIKEDSPAGIYLQEHGVSVQDFNSYGSRRGNDRVMTRGTFANIRIRNQLAPGTEGGVTRFLPDGKVMSIYDAAMKYAEKNIPLVVLAGQEYGTGSSRDWAAKGVSLLGVKAVLAASYERIHRSNLVGMGVLPLQFMSGTTWNSLGLTGEETFTISLDPETLRPGVTLKVLSKTPEGKIQEFEMLVRIDTPVELEYYKNGGILQTVLKKLLETS